MIIPLIFKTLTPKNISMNVPFQRFIVSAPPKVPQNSNLSPSSAQSQSKSIATSSVATSYHSLSNGTMTYDKSNNKIFHMGGYVINTPENEASSLRAFEAIEPEYDLIDSFEEKGEVAKADEHILKLWNESGTSSAFMPDLGIYVDQLVNDLEQRGQFAELFQFCYKYTRQNTRQVRDSVYVLEAICGAHIGLVFKGERAFLRRVANEKEVLGPQEAQKWDRGNDPKSIELFASTIYAKIGGKNGLYGDIGCDNGETYWAVDDAHRLDPTSKEIIIEWAYSNFALNPAKYLKVLQDNFPNGFPKDQAEMANEVVNWSKEMIKRHQVGHPKFIAPEVMTAYKRDHAQKP